MSLLQRTDDQKADHWHPAFTPSGVMTSDVSEVTETDEDVRILNVPDDVQEHAADTLWLDGLKPNFARLAESFEAGAMDALLLLAPSVGSLGYHGHVRLLLEQRAQAIAHHRVIVSQ